MLDFEVRRRLRRLFGEPARIRPEHAKELEGELMARFERLYPEEEKVPMRRLWWRKALVVAAAAMIGGAAACAAPADMEVVVGRSITIQAPAGAAMPEPEKILAVVRGEPRGEEPRSGERVERRIQVGMRRENGVATLALEVWGDEAAEGGVAERIRAAFPELAGAEIREEVLEGTVRGTLGAKLGRDLLDLDTIDEGDVEKARQQVMAQLAAKGVEGKVDVQIEGGPGERRVKVRVEREECPPGEEQAAPEQH